jgi:hypothetical protein
MGATSVMPRLWPGRTYEYALEAVDEIVLVRLGIEGSERYEYADEFVEAAEF